VCLACLLLPQELVELLNSRRPPGLEPLNITISERLNSLATAAR
jgi:hypothetical protein